MCIIVCVCVCVCVCAYSPTVYDDVSGEQMREYRQAVFESLQDYLKSLLEFIACSLCPALKYFFSSI